MDYSQILARYRPHDKEFARIQFRINEFMQKLKNELKKNKINADVMLGGSAAKGTILKNNFDCDIFVRFNKTYRDQNSKLSDILETALKPWKNLVRVHGSRDYFNIRLDNINYEIIPVLLVKFPKDALNVTDMSPLHVSWINSELRKKPALRDEIRLAKVLCIANDLY